MESDRIHKLRNWTITALFVLACVSPSFLAPASAEPVTSPAAGSLNTIVAQTAAAAQMQTSLHLPTSTITPIPSATLLPTRTPQSPTPTPTYIYAFPTFTRTTPTQPPPTATGSTPATQGFVSSGGSASGVTATLSDKDDRNTRFPKIPEPWDCTVVGKFPPSGTKVAPKSKFVVSWTVKNNGTKIWTGNTIDFIYAAGYRSDERPIQDLRSTVAPGGTITLKVRLTASKFPGNYNTYWSLRVGNTKFCHMKQSFEVK